MRSQLHQWIEGDRDYAIGVELYREYGKNSALMALFSSGNSPYAEKRLFAELSAIAALPTPASSIPKPKYQPDELSLALQAEYKRKSALYAEASQIHADMYYAKTNEARKQLREKMMEKFDDISRIWEKCDRYILDKRNPLPKQVEDRATLLQARNNLRTRISKAKKNPAKLEELQKQLEEITTKLNEHE